MKKLLYAMLMMVLIAGLAACGDAEADGKANDNENNAQDEVADEATNDNAAEEANDNSASEDADDPLENENFAQVVDILKENDYEVTDVQSGFDDVVGSEDSVTMVVNGEDMLTLQVFKVEDGHENLNKINETGEATLEFDGQQGDVAGFYAIGNYAFFLGEGHPDSEEVETLIKDNFSPQ
ncbi:hypothetical protein JNUCC1_02045 [Lentibacillus sp. JNUCC-1]|nr:hypothetical protein [Lentibacillus sp. JNUCC-1]